MSDLKEVFFDLFKLLDITLLLRVALADFLYFSSLYLEHFVLHLQFFLIVKCVDGSFLASSFTIDVAMLGECHSFFALDHLIVLVKSYELSIVTASVVHPSPAEGTRATC